MFSLLRNKCLTKKLEEKTVDSYSLYFFLFDFNTQQNVNSSPITRTGVMYTVHCTLQFALVYTHSVILVFQAI